MLTRRHIRIKVFQALYGYTRSSDPDLVASLQQLKQSLGKIYELYLYELRIFTEILRMAEDRIEVNRNKFRPGKEDLNPNLKFVQNRVLNLLSHNELLQKDFEIHRVHWGEQKGILQRLFKNFLKSESYQNYMESEQSTLVEDLHILRTFYAEFITVDEDLHQLYEDMYMHWADDLDVAQMFVAKTLGAIKESNGLTYSQIESTEVNDPVKSRITTRLFKDKDDEEFGTMLLRHTVHDFAGNEKLIAARTRNWDTDRIAAIDILLMQMGIAELVHFPEIPIKVTLNEYIDLSKEYSTPKSGQFINGILDNLAQQLVADKRIVKVGRGLL